jgi:hypothetical protein
MFRCPGRRDSPCMKRRGPSDPNLGNVLTNGAARWRDREGSWWQKTATISATVRSRTRSRVQPPVEPLNLPHEPRLLLIGSRRPIARSLRRTAWLRHGTSNGASQRDSASVCVLRLCVAMPASGAMGSTSPKAEPPPRVPAGRGRFTHLLLVRSPRAPAANDKDGLTMRRRLTSRQHIGTRQIPAFAARPLWKTSGGSLPSPAVERHRNT